MLVGQNIRGSTKKDKDAKLKVRVDKLLEIVKANQKVKKPVLEAAEKARQRAIKAALTSKKDKKFIAAVDDLIEKIASGEVP